MTAEGYISRRTLIAGTVAALGLRTQRVLAIAAAARESGLKDVFKTDFLIGTAIGNSTLETGRPELLQLIAREFNAITPENCMKWGALEPEEGAYQWALPDRFVDFGGRHGMKIVGHNLIWHSRPPAWLFVQAGAARVSAEALGKRMDRRVGTLLDRYRGRVAIWDVVNEAIAEDGAGWRKSPWLEIMGPGFLERAFRVAHEADPAAQLLYNDYNEHNPGRRNFMVNMIRDYRRRGVPLHGVGFQGHVGLDSPDLSEYERSIEAVAAAGVRVHITELDVDVLPAASKSTGAEVSTREDYRAELDPYAAGLPPQIQERLTARYRQLFELFVKHRDKIDRVSTWGTYDGESWKNDFPIRGRTNYPLLFDRQLQPKPAYAAVCDVAKPAR
jgi:endo-1,4-beta-xylanase